MPAVLRSRHDVYSARVVRFNFSVELLTMIVIGGLGMRLRVVSGGGHLDHDAGILRVFQDLDIVILRIDADSVTMYMPAV